MGQEDLTAPVDPGEQRRVTGVLGCEVLAPDPQPEAHQAERHRRGDLEAGIGLQPLLEHGRETDVLPQPPAQPLDAEAPQHEPELQGAEAPPQRNPPVAVVDHLGIALGAQVLGLDGAGSKQGRAIAHEVGRAVEVGEEPLVRVEDEGVGVLRSGDDVPVLGEDGRAAGEGGIHVEEDLLRGAERGDLRQGIERGAARRADRRHHRGGDVAAPAIGGDGFAERGDGHGVSSVHRDPPQARTPEPSQERRLLHRGVGFGRGVDAQAIGTRRARALGAEAEAGGHLARHQQGHQGRAARGVLDHAAEARGQAEQVAEPSEHDLFELGRRR